MPAASGEAKYHGILLKIKFMLRTHFNIKFIFFAISLALLFPLHSEAQTQIVLEWQPVVGSTISGYRVFTRLEGETYDYSAPLWEGTEASCVIDVFDEELNYYFVVQSFSTDGRESMSSDEVCYGCTLCPDDPEKVYAGICGCGTPDRDIDVDLIWDCYDDYIDTDVFNHGLNPSGFEETSETTGCFIEDL